MLLPVAGFVPLAFGALSGSGMAATQSLYGFFVEPARNLGIEPKEVGAVVSMARGWANDVASRGGRVDVGEADWDESVRVRARVMLPLLASLAAIIALRIGHVI